MVVLFDIDGTLVDAGGAGRRSFEKAAVQLLGRSDVLADMRFDGMTDQLIARGATERARPGNRASEREIRSLIEAYLAHIDREVGTSPRYRVLPGVVPLLERLAASGAVLGLCTGNVEQGGRAKLARGDLNRYFPFGGFGDDGEAREDILRAGLRRAEERSNGAFDRREVWVVGDTPRDLEAGRACGVRVMLVASGRHPIAELTRLAPDRCVETLDGVDFEPLPRLATQGI